MGRKTNDQKERKLNWPLSALYLEFRCLETNRKSTAKTNSYKKWIVTVRQKEVDNFMLGSRWTNYIKKKKHKDYSSHESRVAFLLQWPCQTDKIKAMRAAGGLLHHLTPLSSSRIRAQAAQTIQCQSAQGGVGLSSVIGCEHMADHTRCNISKPGFVSPHYPAQTQTGVRFIKKGLMSRFAPSLIYADH